MIIMIPTHRRNSYLRYYFQSVDSRMKSNSILSEQLLVRQIAAGVAQVIEVSIDVSPGPYPDINPGRQLPSTYPKDLVDVRACICVDKLVISLIVPPGEEEVNIGRCERLYLLYSR